MSAKKENPDNYIGRTKEGIRKLKEREYAKIGNPKHLNRRRELHRKNPKIGLRGSAKQRANNKGINFNIPSYKDIPKVPNFCPILEIPLYIGNKVSTDNSPTLDRINNNRGYVKGNIQIISRKANQMKSNANFKEIEMLYIFMKEKQKNL